VVAKKALDTCQTKLTTLRLKEVGVLSARYHRGIAYESYFALLTRPFDSKNDDSALQPTLNKQEYLQRLTDSARLEVSLEDHKNEDITKTAEGWSLCSVQILDFLQFGAGNVPVREALHSLATPESTSRGYNNAGDNAKLQTSKLALLRMIYPEHEHLDINKDQLNPEKNFSAKQIPPRLQASYVAMNTSDSSTVHAYLDQLISHSLKSPALIFYLAQAIAGRLNPQNDGLNLHIERMRSTRDFRQINSVLQNLLELEGVTDGKSGTGVKNPLKRAVQSCVVAGLPNKEGEQTLDISPQYLAKLKTGVLPSDATVQTMLRRISRSSDKSIEVNIPFHLQVKDFHTTNDHQFVQFDELLTNSNPCLLPYLANPKEYGAIGA
jgi:hypothetical protein